MYICDPEKSLRITIMFSLGHRQKCNEQNNKILTIYYLVSVG